LLERPLEGATRASRAPAAPAPRACPHEDCGGAAGCAPVLEVLANPKDEEHREMKRWVGRGYDLEKFDVAAVNKKLATLTGRLGRRRKK
jgi:hypothetical protein